MDVTWGSYHRRQEILREVVSRAEHGRLDRPWSGVPRLSLEFENDAEVLEELHHWWMRLLLARLQGLEQATCPESLYDEVAVSHPGLRAVLDAYVDHPALAEAICRERCLFGAVVAA